MTIVDDYFKEIIGVAFDVAVCVQENGMIEVRARDSKGAIHTVTIGLAGTVLPLTVFPNPFVLHNPYGYDPENDVFSGTLTVTGVVNPSGDMVTLTFNGTDLVWESESYGYYAPGAFKTDVIVPCKLDGNCVSGIPV